MRLKSQLSIKIVVLLIIQSFLFTPVSFAQVQNDCLSPNIELSKPLFESMFLNLTNGYFSTELPEPVYINHDKSFLKEKYKELYSGEPEVMDNLALMAQKLKGKKLIHVNATSDGGGVAEILHYLIPLYRDLGIQAEWYVLETLDKYDVMVNGKKTNLYYEVTKKAHNGTQGDEKVKFKDIEVNGKIYNGEQIYKETTEYNAKRLKHVLNDENNIWFVEDFQPAGLIPYIKGKRIFRLHVDTTGLNTSEKIRERLKFITDNVQHAEAIITHTEEFSPKFLDIAKLHMPPAINMFNEKNRDLSDEEMDYILGRIKDIEDNNLDRDDPFFLCVSRFDPWKGHNDTVEGFGKIVYSLKARIYRIIERSRNLFKMFLYIKSFEKTFKQQIDANGRLKNSHLWLVGNFASDDPEGLLFFEVVKKMAGSVNKKLEKLGVNGRVHIATWDNALNVNAMQRKAVAVLQLSKREGFGLTVAEALWKGTPVIGTRRGGIPDQIIDGFNGFLVDPKEPDSLEYKGYINDIRDKMIKVLNFSKKEREQIGEYGKLIVTEKFSLTSLAMHRLTLALADLKALDKSEVKSVSELSEEVLARYKEAPLFELVFERGHPKNHEAFFSGLRNYLQYKSIYDQDDVDLDVALNFANIYIIRRDVDHEIKFEPDIYRTGCATENGKIYLDEHVLMRALEKDNKYPVKLFERIEELLREVVDVHNDTQFMKKDSRMQEMIYFVRKDILDRPVFSEEQRKKLLERRTVKLIEQAI